MARINTNISSLIAQRNLAASNADLNVHLRRLATGLRLNRGADDPAGLIASERLRSNLRGLEQGVKNSERASGVIATTEGSLAEVSDLLNSIKSLVIEAANTGGFSPAEVDANQRQIDSAIDSITRISNTASFADLNLLNGELGYKLSGVASSAITKAAVNAVQFLNRPDVQVDVQVVESAQQGQLFMRGDFGSNPPFNPPGVDGQLLSTVTLRIGGPDGVQELTFVSGTSIDSVVTAVNALAGSTGVQAARVNPANPAGLSAGVRFFSSEFGSNPFVSVEKVGSSGAFFDQSLFRLINNGDIATLDYTAVGTIVEAAKVDSGKDIVALVNGALATGRGLALSTKTPELDVDLQLSQAFATSVSGTPSSFRITGGGSLYQLGPKVNATQQVSLGIQSIASSRLGGTLNTLAAGGTEFQFLSSLKSGGANSLSGKGFINASRIIDSSIDEVATLRGRLGAFERNTLQTNIRSLQAAVENVTAANSQIRDADFAAETSALTRAQILNSAGTTVLATANTTAQNVLQLLG